MSVTLSSVEVRTKVQELKVKILSKFSNVDVECSYWEELCGPDSEVLEHKGFPPAQPWVQGYAVIRGDLGSAEEAAVLADNEVARIQEESGIVIRVTKTTRVYCLQSRPLVASSPPALSTWKLDRKERGGVIFLCSWEEPHEQRWGRLKPDQ